MASSLRRTLQLYFLYSSFNVVFQNSCYCEVRSNVLHKSHDDELDGDCFAKLPMTNTPYDKSDNLKAPCATELKLNITSKANTKRNPAMRCYHRCYEKSDISGGCSGSI